MDLGQALKIDDTITDADKSMAVTFVTKFHNFDPRLAVGGVKLFEIATSSKTSLNIQLVKNSENDEINIEIAKTDGSTPKSFTITKSLYCKNSDDSQKFCDPLIFIMTVGKLYARNNVYPAYLSQGSQYFSRFDHILF